MELKIVYTLTVILVFSKIAILSGVKIVKGIKTGTFKVEHQHPGINRCAATVLQKNDLVGGRVSNVTGVCEGLSYLWSVNETMESGYAYVKKISVQENYHPPPMTNFRTVGAWMVPGTLSTGAKVEVTFGSFTVGYSVYLVDSSMEFEDYANLAEEVRRSRHYIKLATGGGKLSVAEYVDGSHLHTEMLSGPLPEVMGTANDGIVKVSFQIEADILKILFVGVHVITYSREGLDLKMLRQVVVDMPSFEGAIIPPAIYGFEFIKG